MEEWGVLIVVTAVVTVSALVSRFVMAMLNRRLAGWSRLIRVIVAGLAPFLMTVAILSLWYFQARAE